jgi:hypothetical protein
MAASRDFVTGCAGNFGGRPELSVDRDIQVIFSLVKVTYEWCKKKPQ